MGHYRSEMVSEEEDEREFQRRKEHRDRIAANIKDKIEKEGIEYVLADLLIDPILAKIGLER